MMQQENRNEEIKAVQPVHCPVSGKVIECHAATANLLIANGQRISLCTNQCESSLSEDLHAYVRHINHTESENGEFCPSLVIKGAHVSCPTCSKNIQIKDDTPRTTMRFGQAIFFCNYECLNTFNKKPAKYLKPHKKGKTYIARAFCPCDGQELQATRNTPTVHVDGGQRIFLCSQNCIGDMTTGPAAYVKVAQDTLAFLPEATGMQMTCPCCFNVLLVTNKTPRIQLCYGQSLYFCCFLCLEDLSKSDVAFSKLMHSDLANVRGLNITEKGEKEQEIEKPAIPA